ncbi:alpha tubulin, putative [Perkinsus marinus ATCC 50983]|uniref:Tubulin alpha chain n=1 Tax=Perkinsus marinus (strain ATCC 50983 / TXsc) TaxID=423536 RepID=C5KEH0_PERM5|nr:alpha tubulin, putative [Perkinsus marinus ATCC 50983]EER17108.1 alpha tubulin, putative [Perkinsus marinus ATCC 50983]|eukprot:XP_002785312.1 alpha tubulin, putative [Perkinsus marinus ATCC 50983]
MREVITCHLGQAGCSVGQKVWELFCIEHGIEPDGTMPSDESVGSMEDPFNTFFHETPSGQHVPRTLFMDTDPSDITSSGTKHEILGPRCKWRNLYNPEQVMGYKQDCRSNFFEGRTQAIEYHIVDEMMDRLRKEADKCSNLAGFFTFRSFGGGTGSGIGCELLEALREQFEKKVILEPVLYPSAEYSSSAVEPYNCLFATAYSKAVCDLSLMLDNQAAYKLCRDQLAVKNPTFYHLNRLISQVVSACTTSLRFESMINASLLEIIHNIVPTPVYRYPIVALSPVRHASRHKHESFSTKDIVIDLFEPRSFLCDVGPTLRLNRYLSVCVLILAMMEGRVDALQAINTLCNPKASYRTALRFLPWIESGFKVGVVGVPPSIPLTGNGEPFMARCDRQGCVLANTTAVRTMFLRQYKKFLQLFYHKSYVWQFVDANGEMDMFYEAKEIVRTIIDDHEALLQQCMAKESETNVLELVGSTAHSHDANATDNHPPFTDEENDQRVAQQG